MSVGLPLVCREDMSLRGVLDDGVNGYIYETEQEFVEKTSKLLEDAELRGKMSRAAWAKADATDVSHFIDNTLALYDSVCGH